MSPALQTVIVAVLVIGAIGFVVRRLASTARAETGKPGCPSCEAGHPCDDVPPARR